jgi:two-component system NtrC family sensor kinase
MLELLQSFFADGSFIPHGHCYLWRPMLVWLHILSDVLIAAAYYSIPISLIYFLKERKDFPFKKILLLFGAFIISCGTTHIMEIWTLWHPTYWLAGFLKALTASISVYTFIVLVPMIPQALALPSPAQLEVANSQLKLALNELANMQAQLVHTEKMSSLGQLVAGIAHEVNNPVNFIYGNTAIVDEYTKKLHNLILLYQKNYPDKITEIQAYREKIELNFILEDLPKILSSMRTGAERISSIVLLLRNFSRLDEAEMKAVDIHEGIDSTLLILQNRLQGKPGYPDIQVVRKYSDLPKVECYAGQLNQVFMNIITNAVDAIDKLRYVSGNLLSNYQGEVTINTEVIANSQVMIKIRDNGCGMSEDVKKKIFDPFFTTKPVGSGTGLGMSISYQIINKHGGQFKCITAPLQGTEFSIQIPIYMQSTPKEIGN